MSEWQPIETAPKDGSIVILGCAHPGFRPVAVCWAQDKVRWEWPMSNGRPLKHYDPTHWQPLPAPPEMS